MKRLFFLFLASCSAIYLQAQYKNDNVKYKTVFLEDLCATLKNNPGYLLLDVRSIGEYSDTSSFSSLNIGHLKNAINININELGKKLHEIKNASDKPVFIYCSHSQRSRRASALLADSGFTKVYNINGGLTEFNIMKENGIECADQFFETNNKFNFLSPANLVSFLKNNKDVLILDIRKDSVFNGISLSEDLNAYGKLNNAVNIPYNSLASSLSRVPKNKKIILVDESGADAPKAAEILFDNGYMDISILFNGMYMWNTLSMEELPGKNDVWTTTVKYKMISGDDFYIILKKKEAVQIIDVRTSDEYDNKAKETFRNRGHIKNAINIPYTELENKMNELQKDRPIVLYAFSGQPEPFKTAKILCERGFKEVYVLVGGIWNLRWRAANIKGKSLLSELVVNVPEENQ